VYYVLGDSTLDTGIRTEKTNRARNGVTTVHGFVWKCVFFSPAAAKSLTRAGRRKNESEPLSRFRVRGLCVYAHDARQLIHKRWGAGGDINKMKSHSTDTLALYIKIYILYCTTDDRHLALKLDKQR